MNSSIRALYTAHSQQGSPPFPITRNSSHKPQISGEPREAHSILVVSLPLEETSATSRHALACSTGYEGPWAVENLFFHKGQ